MLNKIVKEILKKIFCLLPLKKIIIFESNPDFADNTYWFYKYLVEEQQIHKDYQLVWYITENVKEELCGAPITCVKSNGNGFREKCITLYYLCRAQVFIECNCFIPKLRNEQIRIYLGHGMPLKMADEYMSGIGTCDLLTITGEGFRKYYEQFLPKEAIKCLGYPRNDVFVNKKNDAASEKIIIWMPTYRQHKRAEEQKISVQFPLGIPIIRKTSDWEKINKYLSERNCYLYLRPHPAQDLSVMKITELSNIAILDDKCLEEMNTTLYELLADSQALITDYSSVYYDYLLNKKPIGVTLEDADEFSRKWKFYIKDIKKELPGEKLQNVEDLLEFIEDIKNDVDRSYEKRMALIERFSIKEELSSPLIWNYLKDRLKR